MSDFEKLKNMDIKELQDKTRLTLARLQDIIDKKFDNIDSTRAHGFIKILERELHLDLSEWLKEFDSYRANINDSNQTKNITITNNENMKENKIKNEHDNKINDSYISKENKQKLESTNTKKSNKLNNTPIKINMPKQQYSYKTIIIAIVIITALILISIGIYLIGNISKPQQTIVINNNDIQKKEIEKDINDTYPTISLQDAIQDKEKGAIETKEIEKDEEIEKNQEKPKIKQAIITPKDDVWFAWVDTITKNKGEKYTKKTPVTITINNPTAFHFGYAVLSIEIDGQKFDYNQLGVTYMLYDGEKMKIITQKEYRMLGGK